MNEILENKKGFTLVGLTGGIASGKSVVANVLKEVGLQVIDTDDVAKEVVEINKPAYKEIVSFFGCKILDKEKNIDRKKLAEIVFRDKTKRIKLNEITHLFILADVQKKITNLIKAKVLKIILVVPLLFETHLEKMFSQIWVVYCEEKTQIKRLMNRDNLTREKAYLRIKSQLSLKEKIKKANLVINSEVPLDVLINTTRKLGEKFIK